MKSFYILLTGTALALVGCAKVQEEIVIPEDGQRIVTLKASVNESDTKVAVNASGVFSWQEDDWISVVVNYQGEPDTPKWVQASQLNNDGTADFNVPLENGESIGQYAFYPAVERSGCDSDGEIVFGLGTQYKFVKDATNMPMLGTITSNGISFRAVGGLLKVHVNNVPEGACFLQVYAGGEAITGAFLVEEGPDGKEVRTDSQLEYWGETIELDFYGFDENDDLISWREDEMDFYIPLPVGTYHSFTFSFWGYMGHDFFLISSKTARVGGDDGLSIGRNEIIVTPVMDATVRPNYPNSIEFDGVPYDYTLDENGVLNMDQFDVDNYGNEIPLYATISGSRDAKLEGEGTISCQLVPTDPNLDPRTLEVWSEEYFSEISVGVDIPTDVPGEFKLVVTYTPNDPNQSPVISAESFTIKVHEAVILPDALKSFNSPNGWFTNYRVIHDGNAYLKTYKASLLETMIPYAFSQSFLSSENKGSFDNFNRFSKITIIPNYAFNKCWYMTGINLPSGLTSIGDYAFAYCDHLESIDLPQSVTSIGSNAFNNCEALTTIDLPDGLTSLGDAAFKECSKLSSIRLPSGVTSIGDNTFNSCTRLKSINLDNVLSIGVSAFDNCDNLTEIVIGDASIGTEAFNECDNLQSVTIGTLNSNSMASIGSEAFYECEKLSEVNLVSVSSIGDFAFYFCSLNSITLSNNLTTIGVSAFQGSGLKAITIPDSVTSIGDYAFAYCYSLEYVEFKSSTPPTIEDVASCFYFAEGDPVPNFKIYVPADENVVSAYKSAWPALQDRIKAKPAN